MALDATPNDKRYGKDMVPQPHGGALKPVKPGEVRNPKGLPKGTKHLSTHIQEILNDPDFKLPKFMPDGSDFKGRPVEAVIYVAVMQALQGESRWAEWLAKHGFPQPKIDTGGGDVTVNINY